MADLGTWRKAKSLIDIGANQGAFERRIDGLVTSLFKRAESCFGKSLSSRAAALRNRVCHNRNGRHSQYMKYHVPGHSYLPGNCLSTGKCGHLAWALCDAR